MAFCCGICTIANYKKSMTRKLKHLIIDIIILQMHSHHVPNSTLHKLNATTDNRDDYVNDSDYEK